MGLKSIVHAVIAMNLIFLHIPKTAGQSFYQFLDGCFEPEEICPARANYQIVGNSLSQLKKFRAFRGHIDWSILDCIGDAFVFTILREPRERILSFYFFLREAAKQLTEQELALPHNRGLKAALIDPPDVFFCSGAPDIRGFHDDLLDNLYTYYFAGRTFSARASIIDALARPDTSLTMNDIVACAVDNIRQLSGAYRVSELDLLQHDLDKAGIRPRQAMRLSNIVLNAGTGDFNSRVSELRELGATARTFDRIERMVEFDSKIWREQDLFRSW